MTADAPPEPPLRAAATRMLGLDPSEPEAARRAVLRWLWLKDYEVGPATHAAVAARSGAGYGKPLVVVADEAWLREEVESFAAGLFERPPGPRRERWRALSDACAGHARLTDRLQGLAPGLDVDRAGFAPDTQAVAWLGDDLFTLFVLRPAPRAARRRELFWAFHSDTSLTDADRETAARALPLRYPDVAALDGGYLRRFIPPPKAVRRDPVVAALAGSSFSWRVAVAVCLVSIALNAGRRGQNGPTKPPAVPRATAVTVDPHGPLPWLKSIPLSPKSLPASATKSAPAREDAP